MSFPETVILGSIAGLTIFLGLPLARVRVVAPRYLAFLNALAIGGQPSIRRSGPGWA